MADFKIVIADPTTGKAKQTEFKDNEADFLMGKSIGDAVSGDQLGFAGYEFVITGGSDKAGFPMRKDISGTRRVKIYTVAGVGVKKKGKGLKQRKTVSPNAISEITSQINLKVTKAGKGPLFEEPEEASE